MPSFLKPSLLRRASVFNRYRRSRHPEREAEGLGVGMCVSEGSSERKEGKMFKECEANRQRNEQYLQSASHAFVHRLHPCASRDPSPFAPAQTIARLRMTVSKGGVFLICHWQWRFKKNKYARKRE